MGEFHERHLQGDLGLALTLDARDALRPDLRALVMSATLDTGPVAALLGGAPVVTSAGRTFPVEVRWAPVPTGARLAPGVAAAVRRALSADAGDVLVFLPGAGEIRGVSDVLGVQGDVDVVALHGGLPAAAQDRALRAGARRRVVLATDLAETSVTVEGVGVVVDAGLARRPSYDPASGLTRLRTTVASRASADQRAGRAGRLRPGVAYRPWSEAEHAGRRPWPDPEIAAAGRAADAGPLLAAAYPDRLAQARGRGRYRLRHGGGAVLPDHDPLAGAEWLVTADVDGAAGGVGRADGRIRLAAVVDRSDVERAGGATIRPRCA
ncbi:MAG: helicase-related protein [Acidimicrobiales bacterium]